MGGLRVWVLALTSRALAMTSKPCLNGFQEYVGEPNITHGWYGERIWRPPTTPAGVSYVPKMPEWYCKQVTVNDAEGTGYYYSPYDDGWCMHIAAADVSSVRDAYKSGTWHVVDEEGVTYLPCQCEGDESFCDGSAEIDPHDKIQTGPRAGTVCQNHTTRCSDMGLRWRRRCEAGQFICYQNQYSTTGEVLSTRETCVSDISECKCGQNALSTACKITGTDNGLSGRPMQGVEYFECLPSSFPACPPDCNRYSQVGCMRDSYDSQGNWMSYDITCGYRSDCGCEGSTDLPKEKYQKFDSPYALYYYGHLYRCNPPEIETSTTLPPSPAPMPTPTPMPAPIPQPTTTSARLSEMPTSTAMPTSMPEPTAMPSPAPMPMPQPTTTSASPPEMPTSTPTPASMPEPMAVPSTAPTPMPQPTTTSASPPEMPTSTPTPASMPEPMAVPSTAPTPMPQPTTTSASPPEMPTSTPTPASMPEPMAVPSPAPTPNPQPTMTCGQIKEAYKASSCCGNPSGIITLPEDDQAHPTMSCGQIVKAYRASSCCGNPNGRITLP
eukprot:TRINITY_DN1120_c0_g1_i1.p1 TRINITY_DN1120_c0_g1~~TRINITY_DN1120_c0_g1_i1.p1  ORF type:complete len:552 (-),score=34.93 TRINITY_DN1120_c0_g1_i1:119-1774(-)